MRTYGVFQLVLCGPLAFASMGGFFRFTPQFRDDLFVFALSVVVVAATAGVGLLLRSDLCAYLAALTNVLFFAGCMALFCISFFELWQPLPAQQHNTDDTPVLTQLARMGLFAMSTLTLVASAILLSFAVGIVRSLLTRRTYQVVPPDRRNVLRDGE